MVGYMGAGKTTLGRAFAREMGLTFVDLDWYIEERYHKTISEIFAERGEDDFRRIEQKMLHEVGEFENTVISTGGGAPCFFDNMAFMKQSGKVVFLDVSVEVLVDRLSHGMQTRPILRGKTVEELRTFIEEALAKRAPAYLQAHYVLAGDRLESRKQITETVTKLRELLGM